MLGTVDTEVFSKLLRKVLEQDVTLRDGETIGFSEGQKLPITRSAGIWHDGMTLKIGYPSKEEGEDENSGET